MLSSILYKEWLKVRLFWGVALVLNIGVFVYLFVDLRHLFTIEHAEMIWYQAFKIGTLHYAYMKYLLVITGVIIGAAQFTPEMIGHRFRLSLHLPVRPNSMVLCCVLAGLLGVAVIGMLDAFMLYTIIARFFPREGAESALLTALPWLFSGLVAYLGTALTAMEPRLSRKFVYLAIAGGFLWLFYQGNDYETYNWALWKPALISMLFIPSVILPAYRYRNRSS